MSQTSRHQKHILFLTCEHAVNTIPTIYSEAFKNYESWLISHRGWDLGAQTIAVYLQGVFGCNLIQATVSRLLIDCNRSLNNPSCFSEISKPWSSFKKHQIIEAHYLPYRNSVIEAIDAYIQEGFQVRHLSIHSFTPILNSQVRNADIGFLYDPRRPLEKKFAQEWQRTLRQQNQTLRVRMNYPYLGKSNGFTTTLRKRYHPSDYLGLEVEINQLHTLDKRSTQAMAECLALSLYACEIYN